MPWGEYPKEYNPKIHGPYNPSVYYGKSKFKKKFNGTYRGE